MPIQFLLGALGVAAGVIGAGGHLSAKETNERAQRISEEAKELYDDAKRALDNAKEKTEKKLLKLGYSKKNVLDTSMQQFLQSYDKVKHVQVTESIGLNEISKFAIDQQDAIEIKQMTSIYSSSIQSTAAGAATGAIVALAASGSLGVVTSSLSVAGSFLAAGQVGAAASVAGSTLSMGAAMTPLAAVAAPVVLFTGISASIKADENLEKAHAMYAEAEAASEKMKVSETLCNAISERSEMFDDLLNDLNKMFSECSSLLAGVIKKKEGKIFKKQLSSADFTEDDLKLLAVTRALAGAVKSVIDTPILSKDGEIAYESEQVYDQVVERLPDFSQQVEEVKCIEYNAKPVDAKYVKNNTKSVGSTGTTVASGARRVFAFVLGVVLASAFSGGIAELISTYGTKVLFVESYTANNIAIWLLICTSVMMLIGKFHNTKTEKRCGFISGISMFVLYVQYVRTVEQMNHYILFSIAFLVVCFILLCVFLTKENWNCSQYFSNMLLVLGCFPILFVVYAFFALFLGFSSGFWLVVTSIVMLLGIPLMSLTGDN